MENKYPVILVGLCLATLIPRVLPFFGNFLERVSATGRRALRLTPYAVLTALIAPGIWSGTAVQAPLPVLVASLLAVGLAWNRFPLVWTVLGAIGCHWFVGLLL
ncbi:MAG: AzlD domain-containing protein [Veillonellaceae bacterium]|nr:AzlD domain-containing protein [Veillonellaceae bacterium]